MSTRQRILDTALDSFGTTGVDGTSLDAIARELDIRKQSILYYYPSKAALFAAAVPRRTPHMTLAPYTCASCARRCPSPPRRARRAVASRLGR